MPSVVTQTEAEREAQASCRPDRISFATFEIAHPSFQDGPIRIAAFDGGTRDTDGVPRVTCTIEGGGTAVFLCLPIRIELPGSSKNQIESGRIVIDNLGRELDKYAGLAARSTTAITVRIRLYVWPDLATMATEPFDLEMPSVTINRQTASAEITVRQLHNREVMKHVYDFASYPTLSLA